MKIMKITQLPCDIAALRYSYAILVLALFLVSPCKGKGSSEEVAFPFFNLFFNRDVDRRSANTFGNTLGSEFLGKRSQHHSYPLSSIENDYELQSLIKRVPGSEFLGKRVPGSEFLGKRVPGSEFLGKRVPGSEFLGKRVPGSEFLGKRVPGSEFLGKRVPGSEFLGKRVPGSEFLGKRVPGSEFLGKRVPGSEFLGKRVPGSEFLGRKRKRTPEIMSDVGQGDRDLFIAKVHQRAS